MNKLLKQKQKTKKLRQSKYCIFVVVHASSSHLTNKIKSDKINYKHPYYPSFSSQRARPGRPPPPRSKSVPRAKSLTEHKQKRMRERSPTIDVTTRIAHQEGKLPNTQKRTMRERSPTIDVTTRIAHQEGKLPNTQKRTMRERSPTIDVTTRIAHQEGKLPNTITCTGFHIATL